MKYLFDGSLRELEKIQWRIQVAEGIATLSSGRESVVRVSEDDMDDRRQRIGVHVSRVLQKMIDRRSEALKDEILGSADPNRPDRPPF